MDGLTDVTAAMAWPSGFPAEPAELRELLSTLRDWATRGPCQKSKRGALFIGDNDVRGLGVNAPPCGPCMGTDACRAQCSTLCNHAERNAIAAGLLKGRRFERDIRKMHVFHLAVDDAGEPRSKLEPSCISCSNFMLEVGVEVVWLYGQDDFLGYMRWHPWRMAEFHKTTLQNCGLPVSPAVALRARLRVVDQGFHSTFGMRYHAKLEGLKVSSGRHEEHKSLLDRAVARLLAAGVTEETPTWEIKDRLLVAESGRGGRDA